MQNKTIAFSITPKGVMNEIHHHIFYQYITSDDVIVGICGLGDHKGSRLRIKSHQTYIVTIMQSALTMTRTSRLTMTRTSVRLYVVQCYIFIGQIPSDVFPNNYALRIMNYEL
jgi:hypothetical protein